MIIARLAGDIRYRLRAIFRRGALEQELNEELALHLEMETEKLIRSGLSPADAARRARMSFGGTERIKDDTRDARGVRWLDVALQDIRYAVRQLSADRRFSIVVVLTLALGVGVNGAVFPTIDRVLLRPPSGISQPGELIRLYSHVAPSAGHDGYVSEVIPYPAVTNIKAVLPPRAEITTYEQFANPLGRGEAPPEVQTVLFGPDYFTLLRVRPVIGHLPSPEEEKLDGAQPVVLISSAEWRARYGGSRAVIGREIELGYKPYTVIGVLPDGFRGADVSAADYWIPLAVHRVSHGAPWYEAWNMGGTNVIVRAPSSAHAGIAARATQAVMRGAPEWAEKMTISSAPILASAGPQPQPAELGIITRLSAVAVILLLIACANVTNLNLARSARRRREIAVRIALGVSKGRLIALLTTEVLLLSVIAAVASMGAAWVGGTWLRAALFPDVVWPESALNVRVALFTFAISIAAGLLSGLPTALRAGKVPLAASLKAGARSARHHRASVRDALVAVQAGLSVLLLVAAAMFVQSLHRALTIDTGYDADQLAVVTLKFDDWGDHSAAIRTLLPVVQERLRSTQNVESIAASSRPPLSIAGWGSLYDASGRKLDFQKNTPTFQMVSPNFFETMGMRILEGRAFTDAEQDPSNKVIVVNRAMADELWPGEHATGKCLRESTNGPCVMVVGVVESAHREKLIELTPHLHYYRSLRQSKTFEPGVLIVRTKKGALTDALPTLRQQVRQVLPARVFPDVAPLTDKFIPELRPWRLGAMLFSGLGVLALGLATIGMYSTVAYSVAQRRHEMAVRMALGARAAQLVELVVSASVQVVAIGAGLGVIAAVLAAPYLQALLYGTNARDPHAILMVAALLIAAAALAALMPAWRAATLDPSSALKVD
jgi:predicted permease